VVHLVGGAGGPLGGDVLRIEIVVGPGAELTLQTVAAAIVLPGASPSVVEVDVVVGEGGSLRWLPEPTVAAGGCDHRARARVVLAAGARLVWREELVRGRYGEAGGSVSSRLSVDYVGRPLVRHQVEVGFGHPAWASPSVGDDARCTGSVLVVDPQWIGSGRPGPTVLADGDGTAAVLPLAGPAVHVVSLAPDARTLRRLLDAGQSAVFVA
jgi:urease accessory protein